MNVRRLVAATAALVAALTAVAPAGAVPLRHRAPVGHTDGGAKCPRHGGQVDCG